MPDEITSVADAFNAARLENPAASPDGAITPPAVEQALATDSDQSEASDPELQAIFNSVDTSEVTEGSIDVESPDFWDTTVVLEGGIPVSLSDMRSGYMMHSDYTQKTQAVAAQAKQLEDADKFYQSYQTDPQEFARAMAVQQGWLAQDITTPVVEVPGLVPDTPDELMQTVNDLVEERMKSDPRMIAGKQAEAEATINAKFIEIEGRLGVTIPNTARGEIVLEARRRGVYDLDLITEHWMNIQRDKVRSGTQLKQSAAARPQSVGAVATGEVPEEISTFADAVLAAKAELSAGA